MRKWIGATAPEVPYCFLQHKGSNVCLDVFCTCGHSSHIDEDFVYKVQCPSCGRIYAVGCYLELVPVEELGDGGGLIEPKHPFTEDDW